MNEQRRQHAIALIEEKVIRIPESGCWIWPDNDVLILDGFKTSAKQIAYEIFNGPIVAGDKITHRCHLECCLNPKHMSLDRSATHCPSAERDKIIDAIHHI